MPQRGQAAIKQNTYNGDTEDKQANLPRTNASSAFFTSIVAAWNGSGC